MARKTKRVAMLVIVRVPIDCSASHARREVRTLLSEKTTYSLEHDDIRAIKVASVKRPIKACVAHSRDRNFGDL